MSFLDKILSDEKHPLHPEFSKILENHPNKKELNFFSNHLEKYCSDENGELNPYKIKHCLESCHAEGKFQAKKHIKTISSIIEKRKEHDFNQQFISNMHDLHKKLQEQVFLSLDLYFKRKNISEISAYSQEAVNINLYGNCLKNIITALEQSAFLFLETIEYIKFTESFGKHKKVPISFEKNSIKYRVKFALEQVYLYCNTEKSKQVDFNSEEWSDIGLLINNRSKFTHPKSIKSINHILPDEELDKKAKLVFSILNSTFKELSREIEFHKHTDKEIIDEITKNPSFWIPAFAGMTVFLEKSKKWITKRFCRF